MDANDYQQQAARTLIDGNDRALTGTELMMLWTSIGIAGEAGEVCEHIKKGVLHRHGVNRTEICKELGDVLWYIAGLCTVLGIDLDDVMRVNIDKLRARYPDGWSEEASKHRQVG